MQDTVIASVIIGIKFFSHRHILENECFSREYRLYPDTGSRHNVRVLVPGSGLGRLPWEVAARGYSCQGNEFSYYMIVASNFILNCLPPGKNSIEFYPWCLQSSNVKKGREQIRGVAVPDIHPTSYGGRSVASRWNCSKLSLQNEFCW